MHKDQAKLNAMSLAGRAAIVSGGSSGLGEAIVNLFAAEGAKVYILDQQPPLAGDAAKGKFIQCDVTDEASVQRAVDQVGGNIHILVNSAGIARAARLATPRGAHDAALFKKVMDVNVNGTFLVMKTVAARMVRQPEIGTCIASETVRSLPGAKERGVIINIASIAAYEGEGGQVAYAASKGAVVSMTLPAARDLRKFGIRVVALAPGMIHTPMAKGMTPEVQAAVSKGIPFPARLGHGDEVAHLALAVVQNSYLNGTTIRIDAAKRLSSL